VAGSFEHCNAMSSSVRDSCHQRLKEYAACTLFFVSWNLTPCSLVDKATTHQYEKLASHINNFRLREGRHSTYSLHLM
jgi:hypothetical protein